VNPSFCTGSLRSSRNAFRKSSFEALCLTEVIGSIGGIGGILLESKMRWLQAKWGAVPDLFEEVSAGLELSCARASFPMELVMMKVVSDKGSVTDERLWGTCLIGKHSLAKHSEQTSFP